MYVNDFPDAIAPAVALSHYYLIMDQPDQALPLVERLLHEHPDNPASHVAYGDYLAATGDTAGALREFEAVLANPQTPAEMRLVVRRRINELKGTPNP
jgi:predicted Zn-dependent protease